MPVTPLPGTDRRNLREVLRNLHTEAMNIRSRGDHGGPPIGAYFRWTDSAVSQLTGQIAERDIHRLVLTPRYWALLGSPTIGTPQFYQVLAREIDQRIAEFEAARTELEAQIARWTDLATYVVPDTSFFCQGERLFDQADYHHILGINWRTPIRALIPIAVVDELDELKEARTAVRHRARVSLAILDRVVAGSPQDPHELRSPELRELAGGVQAPTGDLTIEILFDPPGHVRLPIIDDEIIDRALSIQPLAGREVALLTCDTNQSFRARSVGLRAVKARRKDQETELKAAYEAEETTSGK